MISRRYLMYPFTAWYTIKSHKQISGCCISQRLLQTQEKLQQFIVCSFVSTFVVAVGFICQRCFLALLSSILDTSSDLVLASHFPTNKHKRKKKSRMKSFSYCHLHYATSTIHSSIYIVFMLQHGFVQFLVLLRRNTLLAF